jgi:hypothetical protein
MLFSADTQGLLGPTDTRKACPATLTHSCLGRSKGSVAVAGCSFEVQMSGGEAMVSPEAGLFELRRKTVPSLRTIQGFPPSSTAMRRPEPEALSETNDVPL